MLMLYAVRSYTYTFRRRRAPRTRIGLATTTTISPSSSARTVRITYARARSVYESKKKTSSHATARHNILTHDAVIFFFFFFRFQFIRIQFPNGLGYIDKLAVCVIVGVVPVHIKNVINARRQKTKKTPRRCFFFARGQYPFRPLSHQKRVFFFI